MRRRDLMDNTWVVISADHGDYGGEKSLITKTESLYECLLHEPLIITPPVGGQWDRGSKVACLVDHADLFPTILSITGVDVPQYVQGHDLVSWL